jgi:hypothetical protein
MNTPLKKPHLETFTDASMVYFLLLNLSNPAIFEPSSSVATTPPLYDLGDGVAVVELLELCGIFASLRDGSSFCRRTVSGTG